MPEASFNITIIGLGLMGGSFALATKSNVPHVSITGVDAEDICQMALDRNVVDHATPIVKDAVVNADVVVVATPISAVRPAFIDMAPVLPSHCLVTDICSVKLAVQAAAEECLPPNTLYVGGHPMTGSEKTGLRHADVALFENATYVLCPPSSVQINDGRYQKLKQVINLLGSRILEMPATNHDLIASRVSHLPQLLSVLLVNVASQSKDANPDILQLAAGGFRDMTRIASSSFPMWNDILSANEHEIVAAMDVFENLWHSMRDALSQGDTDAIRNHFHDSEQTRDFIPSSNRGFLNPLADIYVFTSDRPGALVSITTALFKAELSIKDIELLRIRENTGGTFRLGFDHTLEADQAVQILTEIGFSAYRL